MLPKLSKILYCTDFSKSSTTAFEHTVNLARITGAEIHILHVIEKLSNDARITFLSYVSDADSRNNMLKERANFARKTLQEIQEKFWSELSEDEQNIRQQIKSTQVIESYPAETILQMSLQLKTNMIILGAHERGVVHTFLGSVAKSVLRRATVPVLVVPNSEES